jgi:hypothetical protein
MPSIYFNPHEPGALGRVVLRRVGDKVVFSRPPIDRRPSNAPNALAARLRFNEAATYSKGIVDSPTRRAPYDAVAADKKQPVFSVIMTDFLRSPVIQSVDTSGYHGQVGDALVVAARTDLPLVGVTMTLRRLDGTEVESGAATLTAGKWRYLATQEVPAGAALTLVVTVTDADGIELTRTLPVIVA